MDNTGNWERTEQMSKLQRELEALREVEKVARNICELLDTVGIGHIESQHDIDGLSDAWYQMLTLFKNLDKVRQG